MGMSYLTSWNTQLFKNIAYVGSFGYILFTLIFNVNSNLAESSANCSGSGKFSFIKTICKRWYFCTKIFYKYFEKAFKQMFSTIGLQVPVLKKHALLDQSQKNFKSWQKLDYQC